MEDNAKVIKALMAGLAAGIAIGILMAPEKGIDTQDVLTGSIKNLGKSIKETAASEINHLVELKDEIVNAVKSIIIKAEKSFVPDDLEHA